MTMPMRISALALLLPIAASSTVDAAPKAAGKPAAAACGARILPLVEGTTWTYESVPPRDAILPELAKLAPRPAKTIKIVVKSVATKGADTVVSLEETNTYEIVAENKEKKKPAVMADVVVNSTITCNKTKFEISPDSFFFAGEPGGFRNLELDKIERTKATSLKLVNGNIGDDAWEEDISAHFIRKPGKGADNKLSAGKIELERSFTPAQPEDVATRKGTHYRKAEKLQLITTGRITLDSPVSPTPKLQELPKNWVTLMWLSLDIGVVQTLNMFAHQYQLTESSLLK
jgi:hypothetical protein